MTDRTRGLLITSAGVLLLTPDALLVRLVDRGPWEVLFWRGLLMGVSLFALLLARYRGRFLSVMTGMGVHGPGAALAFAVSTTFFVTALSRTSAANVLVIISTSPLFAAFLSRIFLHERLPGKTRKAIAFALVGIVITMSDRIRAGATVGELCAFGTAFGLACQFTLLRSAGRRDMTGSVALAGWLVALLAATRAQDLVLVGPERLHMAVLGFIVLPGSFALISVGPRYLPAAEVSLLMILETVLGPFWVWMVLGEDPGATTLVGGAIVVTTLVWHALQPPEADLMEFRTPV